MSGQGQAGNQSQSENQSALLDMTRSASQWYNQMSISNINVPKFSSTKDVYDFIIEYEDVTATLADEQRPKLLNKAFRPGDHSSWFEIELKPAIDEGKPWSHIKSKIIDRFSIQGDRDRHFTRLRELKFNPDSQRMLLDFVDDMLYSYKRAYNSDFNEESCIRFIKSSLPQGTQATLSADTDYREARNIETLKRAAKQYDLSRRLGDSSPSNRQATSELASMVKELAASFRKELELSMKDNAMTRKDNETTRNAVVAALRFNQRDNDSSNRESQPRSTYQDRRTPSPAFRQRSPSPRPYDRNYSSAAKASNKDGPSGSKEKLQRYGEGANESKREAFSSKSYFEAFGMPPSPCTLCNENSWHWSKHCFKNLN